VNHVLSVGEIYDKAIDLCLRNTGKIVLVLGVLGLISDTLNVLASRSEADTLLKTIHLRLHGATTTSAWIVGLGYLFSFGIFPIAEAALCVLFDHALRGEPVGLKVCFSSPFRRKANVAVASFLSAVYSSAPAVAIVIIFLGAAALVKQPVIDLVLGLAALGLVICLTGFVAIGVAIGFAKVALDAGRVNQSLRFGIAWAFAKPNRRRALGVGIPLAFILAVGNFGGYYAGIIAFGLTGADAANVIVQSIGDTIAWGLTAAVATICYRNLTPLA
jgi:hypothetical protein